MSTHGKSFVKGYNMVSGELVRRNGRNREHALMKCRYGDEVRRGRMKMRRGRMKWRIGEKKQVKQRTCINEMQT